MYRKIQMSYESHDRPLCIEFKTTFLLLYLTCQLRKFQQENIFSIGKTIFLWNILDFQLETLPIGIQLPIGFQQTPLGF